MILKPHFALYCWLTATVACWGQAGGDAQNPHQFYAEQARTDGLTEQELTFAIEKDEWDYWKDQRAYERQLYIKDAASYAAYIRSKKDVYAAHQPLCSDACGHGDYYFIQASFYLQFGQEDAALMSRTEAGTPVSFPGGIYKH